jgi:hypothetical protein
MTGPRNVLFPPENITLNPVRRTWQEVRERTAGIVRNETNERVTILSENNGLGTHLPREIDHDVIATGTSRATDPPEITETVETIGILSVVGSVVRAVTGPIHPQEANLLGGTGALNAIASTAVDQSRQRKSGRPTHDGHEQSDQRMPNVTAVTPLLNHFRVRLELQPVRATRHKPRPRTKPWLLQRYGAITPMVIRIPWKISLVHCLLKMMALSLFVRVAEVHTSPAPATSMPTLLQTTIPHLTFSRMTIGFRLWTSPPVARLRVS